MKKQVLTLLLIVPMLFTAACGGFDAKEKEPGLSLPKDIDRDMWEGQNNKQNENDFYSTGNWIYGQFWDEEGISQFVRARDDGSEMQVIEEDAWAHFITARDDKVYYALKQSPDPEKDGIYKMNKDGTAKERLADAADAMQLCGEKIYYTDAENYHLYAMDLNGENKTAVLKKPVFYFFAFPEQILYQDDNDGETLHLYDMVLEKDAKVTEDIAYCPIYDGEFIYYIKSETSASKVKNDEEWEAHMKGRSIWRIRPDGTCDALVSRKIPGNGLMLLRDELIFTDYENDNRICSLRKDGEELKVLCKDTRCEAFSFCGNYLKYTVRDENGYIKNNYLYDLYEENTHPFKEY